jgi:fluoride exporter
VDHGDEHAELPLDPDAPDTRTPPGPLHLQPSAIAIVGAGGLVGTAARYGLAVAVPTASGGWPWATFTANMLGAFVLGALLEWLAQHGPDEGWRRRVRLLLGTGFCGGLTTYSTFATEADLLIRSHDDGLAVAYMVFSVVGGLVATVAGVAAAAAHHRGLGRAVPS